MLYYKNFAQKSTNFSGQGEMSENSWFYLVENRFCLPKKNLRQPQNQNKANGHTPCVESPCSKSIQNRNNHPIWITYFAIINRKRQILHQGQNFSSILAKLVDSGSTFENKSELRKINNTSVQLRAGSWSIVSVRRASCILLAPLARHLFSQISQLQDWWRVSCFFVNFYKF